MDKAIKFLGVCIIIAAIILGTAHYMRGQAERYYQFERVYILDRQTGDVFVMKPKNK